MPENDAASKSTVECSGTSVTYSEDEFEQSLSPSSTVFPATDDTNDARHGLTQEKQPSEQHESGESTDLTSHTPPSIKLDTNISHYNDEEASRAGCNNCATVEVTSFTISAAKSDVDDGEEERDSHLAISLTPSSADEGCDSRTAKQRYLDLNNKVAVISQEAAALAQRRYDEDLQVKQEAQQTKDAWHMLIHRRSTETEWHRKVASRTAESIVEVSLHREAWTRGASSAKAKRLTTDREFSSVLGSLLASTAELEEATVAAKNRKAIKEGEKCLTPWDAARYGVPVRRLRELMQEKVQNSRHTDPSEVFEQLCRRAGGVVVESRHPYPKGVRQDVNVNVPGADHFYVAFDAASNATTGRGKVVLQGPVGADPAVFFIRGPYCEDIPGDARLPGVNGEPPLRMEGSSVLVTFSASYWPGLSPAGEDYGWRLVCYTADGRGHDAAALVADSERAADRSKAVDAFNALGETCLHVACFEGNVAAARYLLSVDADPNSAHTAGACNTPLHEAARGGSLAATILLLKSSANVLAANAQGELPLHVACRRGRIDIARRLLAHDSDWSTIAACNHAGLRPSDIVFGCAALSAVLHQVARNASKALAFFSAGTGRTQGDEPVKAPRRSSSSAAMEMGASGARRTNRVSPSAKHPLVQHTSQRRNHIYGSHENCERDLLHEAQELTYGRPLVGPGRYFKPRQGGVIRRLGVRQPLSLEGRAPVSRLARLPRPLGPKGSGSHEEETISIPSLAGSGTSYGASLAESDFKYPGNETL